MNFYKFFFIIILILLLLTISSSSKFKFNSIKESFYNIEPKDLYKMKFIAKYCPSNITPKWALIANGQYSGELAKKSYPNLKFPQKPCYPCDPNCDFKLIEPFSLNSPKQKSLSNINEELKDGLIDSNCMARYQTPSKPPFQVFDFDWNDSCNILTNL